MFKFEVEHRRPKAGWQRIALANRILIIIPQFLNLEMSHVSGRLKEKHAVSHLVSAFQLVPMCLQPWPIGQKSPLCQNLFVCQYWHSPFHNFSQGQLDLAVLTGEMIEDIIGQHQQPRSQNRAHTMSAPSLKWMTAAHAHTHRPWICIQTTKQLARLD